MKILCVPGVVVRGIGCAPIGEVTALEIEVGFGNDLTSRVFFPIRHADPAEGFDVAIERIATGVAPLRAVKESVRIGDDGFTHETLGAGDRFRTDFSHPHTLGRNAGDLEKIVVGLVIAPRHIENVTNFDVVRI